ncbi:MAG: hypothetical protein JXL67_05895 [Calditrichaeota bacterium]|nr:hypothetical protein [Calditrichota bacterium]
MEKRVRTILKNVKEGIFFLSQNFEIKPDYSQSIENILGIYNLENKNFIILLENRIPSQIINNTREYLELMFREDLDEEVINELNPLVETEFFYEDDWGIWTSSKYLSFNFKRVIVNNKIEELFVSIKDATEKVLLSKKLKQTEEHTQK